MLNRHMFHIKYIFLMLSSILHFEFFKIRGEDSVLYTIQMINTNKSNGYQARNSLSSRKSPMSMIQDNRRKKTNTISTSKSKLQRSTDAQSRSLTSRTTYKISKLMHPQYNNDEIPFSELESICESSFVD